MKFKKTLSAFLVGSTAVMLCTTAAHAVSYDTTGTTINFSAPMNLTDAQISGDGTLNFNGSGLLGLGNSGFGPPPVTFAMTGGDIKVQSGVTLRNGGWQGGVWTNNKASMDVASGATLDVWDGNEVRIDALTGAGNVTISSTHGVNWASNRSLVLGVNGGSGTFTGVISGNNTVDGGSLSVTKEGVGTQTLSGANTYSGITAVGGGTLLATHNTALGVGGFNGGTMTYVGSGATLALQGGISVSEHLKVYGNGFSNLGAVRSLSGNNTLSTAIALGSNVTVGVDAGSLTISNTVYQDGGAFGLTKVGAGTLNLTVTNSYSGPTSVNEGKLVVNGNITTSVTTVASGATLGGSGTVGALTVNSCAFVTPGNSPGILTVDGNYTQAGTYTAEIAGTTAGSGYDQIDVLGAVDITGGSLATLFSGGGYTSSDLLFILLNDGTDAILGTYTGFAQGATVATFGGFDWAISYIANGNNFGSPSFTGGNDIALMAIPEPDVAALLGGLGVLGLLRRKK